MPTIYKVRQMSKDGSTVIRIPAEAGSYFHISVRGDGVIAYTPVSLPKEGAYLREISTKPCAPIIDADQRPDAKKTPLAGARTAIVDADRFSLREGK